MTHHTKPYFVTAMHAIDGQVLLGEFDTEAERDQLFRTEYKAWRNGGMDPDVQEILRGEVHGMCERKAEEADLGIALMAQYEQPTRQTNRKGR